MTVGQNSDPTSKPSKELGFPHSPAEKDTKTGGSEPSCRCEPDVEPAAAGFSGALGGVARKVIRLGIGIESENT